MDFNDTKMPIVKQAEMLSLNRSSLYFEPAPPSEKEVALKHAIDSIYTEDPCFGSRTISAILKREGYETCRTTIQRYMREMGISAIYPKRNLSKRNYEHKVYPYLLRNINRVITKYKEISMVYCDNRLNKVR